MPAFHPKTPLDLFDNQIDHSLILTGNEAYARGLYEANVKFFANYPGTPTSEIGDLWAEYANNHSEIIYDLSINETIAFEAAVGASWSGVRSAVAFKHLGMNLISDALHTVMYSGIDGSRNAGLVIICGGDPDIDSSTNAQDVRLFSFHSKLPILEPSTSQECKDFILFAFELSEIWNIPVLIYSPARLNQASGIVRTKAKLIRKNKNKNEDIETHRFIKDFNKYLNAIHWAKINQAKLNSIIFRIEENIIHEEPKDLVEIYGNSDVSLTEIIINNESRLQTEKLSKLTHESLNESVNELIRKQIPEKIPKKVGIISSGISWLYCQEICDRLALDIPRLRLKLSYPIKKQAILDFITLFKIQTLIVIEEQESFLEMQLKNLLFDNRVFIEVLGKNIFPKIGSLNPDIIIKNLGSSINFNSRVFYYCEFAAILQTVPNSFQILQKTLSVREPTFCPGCSHRNVFYALKKAANKYYDETQLEPIYGGDIGCYTMSMSNPYRTMDWLICMGAGVGISNGVGRIIDPTKQHLVTMIGDSTFFHSGIQPIQNLAKDNVNVLVIILDNFYTAMTGHQDSPSTPAVYLKNHHQKSFSIDSILKTLGNFPIEMMDGYSVRKMQSQFHKLFGLPGLKFALVKAECALNKKRRISKNEIQFEKEFQNLSPKTILSIADYCTQCNECFEELGCTAITSVSDQYTIDESRCLGEKCLSCLQVCPNHAILKTIINPHLAESIKKLNYQNKDEIESSNLTNEKNRG